MSWSGRPRVMLKKKLKSFHFQRENESLQFQLEAYINEVDVIKLESQKEMDKFKAQFIARQALQAATEKNVSSNILLKFYLPLKQRRF